MSSYLLFPCFFFFPSCDLSVLNICYLYIFIVVYAWESSILLTASVGMLCWLFKIVLASDKSVMKLFSLHFPKVPFIENSMLSLQ